MEPQLKENETQLKDNLESLLERTGEYVETRIELYKLKAVDKSSDILSSVISNMIVVLAFVMFIFIINIAVALLLGEWLGKAWYGFFVLAGFYLIAGIILMYMRTKWFKDPLADKMIQKFLK